MAASHWGFVLMALHLGLHWGMFLGMAKKALKPRQPSRLRKVLFPILGAGIAVYGLSVFIRRDFLTYMLLQTHFVFLDYSEPVPLFYFGLSSYDGRLYLPSLLCWQAAAETVG